MSKPFYRVQKKIHWSDSDAAGIAWFANYFRWFEDAEEELFAAALGQSRQALLDANSFGMPRVEATARYRAPIRAGQTIEIGIACTVENPRRLRHDFEMRTAEGNLVAEGHVRVACVDLVSFAPRDLPDAVIRMVDVIGALAVEQARGGRVPWV